MRSIARVYKDKYAFGVIAYYNDCHLKATINVLSERENKIIIVYVLNRKNNISV